MIHRRTSQPSIAKAEEETPGPASRRHARLAVLALLLMLCTPSAHAERPSPPHDAGRSVSSAAAYRGEAPMARTLRQALTFLVLAWGGAHLVHRWINTRDPHRLGPAPWASFDALAVLENRRGPRMLWWRPSATTSPAHAASETAPGDHEDRP